MRAIVAWVDDDAVAPLEAAAASLTHQLERITSESELDAAIDRREGGCIVVDQDLPAILSEERRARILARFDTSEVPIVAVSTRPERRRMLEYLRAGAKDYLSKPFHLRELILRLSAVIAKKTRVVSIGGGTGLYVLLSAVKLMPNVLPISVVSMADDGGSSGRLSASFEILPPGDVRKSLVALSNAPDLMNHVIQYRFSRSQELSGHSVGNLILTALAEMTGSIPDAVKALGDILNVQGLVLCASRERSTLCALFEDGRVVRGESNIDRCLDRPHDLRIQKLWHEPEAEVDADAYALVAAAEVVTIGPGDLYTSVIAGLSLEGIRDAVANARGKRVYFCNLMTKPGETSGYAAVDHLREIVRYLGGDHLEQVIVSNTRFSAQAIAEYAGKAQHPVIASSTSELREVTRAELVYADIAHESQLVRHDSAKLRRVLLTTLDEPRRPH